MSVTAERLGKDNVVNGKDLDPLKNNKAVQWETDEGSFKTEVS